MREAARELEPGGCDHRHPAQLDAADPRTGERLDEVLTSPTCAGLCWAAAEPLLATSGTDPLVASFELELDAEDGPEVCACVVQGFLQDGRYDQTALRAMQEHLCSLGVGRVNAAAAAAKQLGVSPRLASGAASLAAHALA